MRSSSIYSNDDPLDPCSHPYLTPEEASFSHQMYEQAEQSASTSKLPSSRPFFVQQPRLCAQSSHERSGAEDAFSESVVRESSQPTSPIHTRTNSTRTESNLRCNSTSLPERRAIDELAQAEEQHSPIEEKLMPPPLVLRKSSLSNRPTSRFSMDSDEDWGSDTRSSFLSTFRKPSSSKVYQVTESNGDGRRSRKRPLFSPLSIPNKFTASTDGEDEASSCRFMSRYLRPKQGAADSPIPRGARILPTSARRPSGPDTPHPHQANGFQSPQSPTARAKSAMQRRASQLKAVVQKAKRTCLRSPSERRRHQLRQHVKDEYVRRKDEASRNEP